MVEYSPYINAIVMKLERCWWPLSKVCDLTKYIDPDKIPTTPNQAGLDILTIRRVYEMYRELLPPQDDDLIAVLLSDCAAIHQEIS